MNEAIYKMADSGGSIRIVVQKKPDGDYIVGVSNGKDTPLICQGSQTQVDAEFDVALPGYLDTLKTAAIEAKLRAVEEPPAASEDTEENDKEMETAAPASPALDSKTKEQPELDFGF